MTREQKVRRYANHLALMVRGSVGAFELVERPNNMRGSVGKKREIGTFQSIDALERAIDRYGLLVQKELRRKRPRI